jgi:hypothetical protein
MRSQASLRRGTRAHYHLEFDLLDGTSDEDVRAAVTQLREPAVTVGGFNLFVGFGPSGSVESFESRVPGSTPGRPGRRRRERPETTS